MFLALLSNELSLFTLFSFLLFEFFSFVLSFPDPIWYQSCFNPKWIHLHQPLLEPLMLQIPHLILKFLHRFQTCNKIFQKPVFHSKHLTLLSSFINLFQLLANHSQSNWIKAITSSRKISF